MFFGNIDRRTLWTVLGVCIVVSLLMTGAFKSIIIALPGVIIAMTFHEFAHAWMADRLGDKTPRIQGRLTLNPLSHIDPFGLVLLLFANIGWGKPVEINPNNFNSNKSRSTCEMLVALAGPVMNFILAFLFMIIYYALYIYTNVSWLTLLIVSAIISVNIGLGVFNLIPIPPLDGSKIFSKILPYKVQEWLDNNMQTIYIVFLVLWVTGVLSYLVAPVISVISDGLEFIVAKVFSLFL